jgi:signal peptidase II
LINHNSEKNDARPDSDRAFLKGFAMPVSAAWLIFWPLVVVGIALDLWSKWAIFDWLETKPDGRFSIIDGFLQLVRAENAGAAFGIASGQRYILVTVSVLALLVILTMFFFSRTGQKLMYVAFALFAAGICGNLYDRIFNGGFVRDFLDVYYQRYHWPAFNVADSLLCIGVGLLIITSLFSDKPFQKHAQPHK